MSEANTNILQQKKKSNMAMKNLRDSYKINIPLQDTYQFLHVPKVDEPLPDIDELSTESPILIGRNSLISQ